MKQMTNRQEQKLKTRQKIVEAANTCFVRKGMIYTLISDICKEAEVSVGTFYHYFTNKNDLIISEFKKFDMGFLEIAERLIDNPDAIDSLLQFSLFFSRDADMEDRMLTIEYLKARVSLTVEQLFPQNRPYFLILCTVIYNGQIRKQIRDDRTPFEIARMVMAVTRGYNFDWASMDGKYDLIEKIRSDMPLILQGLAYHPDLPHHRCAREEVFPEQNLPESYAEQTEQLRKYCESRLIISE